MANPALMTELEAVNLMLRTIDSAPTDSLEDSANVDVISAKSTLDETLREVQEAGYSFNSEEDYVFTPNVDNEINLNASMVSVDRKPDNDGDYEVVVRGSRLYNKTDRTYTFTTTVTADVVWLLPWTELPQYARRYIAHRAARKFRDRTVGETSSPNRDELAAHTEFKKAENKQADRRFISTNRTRFSIRKTGRW